MTPKLDPTRTGRRVLVVDDDPAVCELSSTLLTQAGCIVETAGDGYSAIDLLEEFQPEAMILDLMMPAMDGYGVLEHMRKMGLTDQVRTLVLTAKTQREDVDRAVGLGARDYLSKPYTPEQLVLRVARLLIRNRTSLVQKNEEAAGSLRPPPGS